MATSPTLHGTCNDLVLEVVPEPATMIVLALGAGLALIRRRQVVTAASATP